MTCPRPSSNVASRNAAPSLGPPEPAPGPPSHRRTLSPIPLPRHQLRPTDRVGLRRARGTLAGIDPPVNADRGPVLLVNLWPGIIVCQASSLGIHLSSTRCLQMGDSKTPTAITSTYKLGISNEPIDLYSGPFEIDMGQGSRLLEGSFRLVWLPRPHVAIQACAALDFNALMQASWQWMIKVLNLDISMHVNLVSFSGSPAKTQMSFQCLSNLGIGKPEGFASVVFHVVNLREFHAGECRHASISRRLRDFEQDDLGGRRLEDHARFGQEAEGGNHFASKLADGGMPLPISGG